jgi:hypothetical protein
VDRRLRIAAASVLASLVLGGVPGLAQEDQPPLRFVGQLDLAPRTLEVDDTVVGGLSGLTYDARRDVFYVISDDRGDFGPARFYTMRFDLAVDGPRAFEVVGVTVLDSDADAPGIQPYDSNDSDTEEIVLLPDDTLLISSERDRQSRPWVRRFALDGSLLGEWQLPDVFVPASATDAQGRTVQNRGVRSNLAFEGVAYAADDGAVYVMNEQSLAQDGPTSTPQAGTFTRLLRLALVGDQVVPGRQTVYHTEPIFASPNPPDAIADNGVSSMLWVRGLLPPYDLLVMERAFVPGVGNGVNLFGVSLAGADDVSGLPSLGQAFTGRTMTKTLLASMAALGITPDNLEGMALGPRLADGRQSLLVISDDNFSDTQVGQFLLFEIGAPLGGTGK